MTAAPTPDVVALAQPVASRRAAVVMVIILSLSCGGLVVLGTGAIFNGLTAPEPVAIFLGVGLWLSAVLPAVMIEGYARVWRARNPHVAVSPQGLTISDTAVFVGPQRIAWGLVRKVVFGPGVTATFRSYPPHSKNAPVVLSVYPQAPNALIIFVAPVHLDRAYVPVPMYRDWIGRPPDRRQAVDQAWLVLEDPAVAFAAVRPWCSSQWEDGALGQSVWIR